MKVKTTCPMCGKTTEIEVEEKGYKLWKQGARIQDALGTLTADQREMLISGICPVCWDRMWGVK